MKKNAKIVPYKKPINFNIGMIIFAIIAAYVVVCMFMYIKSDPVKGYEVKEGSLSVTNIYTGIALRDEETAPATKAGYINYYAREGEKVGVGDIIYTVDSTGKLNELLYKNSGNETALSENDLNQIKSDIIRFSKDYSDKDFSSIYNFKYNLQGTSLKLTNLNIINNIDGGLAASGIDIVRSPKSGYIVYNTDGFEDITPADITTELFNEDTYEKTQLLNSELISTEDVAYKYINSENWSIVVPIEEEKGLEYEAEDYVQVKFLKSQDISWGQCELLHNNGDTFLCLHFNNSVVNYCTDRFIDIQIMTQEEKGLKIPNSAIAEREFYLVPKDYASNYNASNDTYLFKKEAYMEDGTLSTQTMELTVYNANDEYYYISDDVLDIGNYLIKDDSEDKYAVSKKDKLIGVYNINKGYADFRQIKVLFSNDDYSIVESNTDYGLNCYDYIVLEAESVKENDFVYE